jgi:hypothetical protein
LRTFALLACTGALLGGPALAAQAEETVFTPLTLPTITGTATEGETLQEHHGTWSEPPASYAYQWQRCNATGKNCSSIEHANARSYRLTAADVGSTIRVGEDAKNAAGAVTPALSEPTAVVQGPGGGGGGGQNGGGGGGGGQNGGGGGPSGSHTPPHSAQLKRLLARQLAPAGAGATIPALLRHGGLHMSFALHAAGTLTVRWYLLAAAGHRLVLAAVGTARLSAAKAVQVRVKLTARGAQLLRHAAKARVQATGAFRARAAAPVSATRTFTLRG